MDGICTMHVAVPRPLLHTDADSQPTSLRGVPLLLPTTTTLVRHFVYVLHDDDNRQSSNKITNEQTTK